MKLEILHLRSEWDIMLDDRGKVDFAVESAISVPLIPTWPDSQHTWPDSQDT